MPIEPLDVLIKIRAVAGNGMHSAAHRFDRIEEMIAEGRALLPKAPEAETTPRRSRRETRGGE